MSRTYAASVLLNAAAAGLGILECRLTPGRREPSNTAYDAYVRRIQGEASETPRRPTSEKRPPLSCLPRQMIQDFDRHTRLPICCWPHKMQPRLMLRSKDVQQSLTIEPMAVAVGGWVPEAPAVSSQVPALWCSRL